MNIALFRGDTDLHPIKGQACCSSVWLGVHNVQGVWGRSVAVQSALWHLDLWGMPLRVCAV